MLNIHNIKKQYLKVIGNEKQWDISDRNEIMVVRNLLSLDQFSLHQIPVGTDIKLLEHYHHRQILNLPNTPKIILLKHGENQNRTNLLLGQIAPYDYQRLMQCYQEGRQLIQLFRKIISTVQMLCKKYGYFDITEQMIRTSKGDNPIIWINEDELCNEPQFCIQKSSTKTENSVESSIIFKIIDLFLKFHKGFDLQLKKKNLELTFSDILVHIHQILSKKITHQVSSSTGNIIKLNYCIGIPFSINSKINKIPNFLLNKSQSQSPKERSKKKCVNLRNLIILKEKNRQNKKKKAVKNASQKGPHTNFIKSQQMKQFHPYTTMNKQIINPHTYFNERFSSQQNKLQINSSTNSPQFQFSLSQNKKTKGRKSQGIKEIFQKVSFYSKQLTNKNNYIDQLNFDFSTKKETQIQGSCQSRFTIRQSGQSFSTTVPLRSINSSSGKRYGKFDQDFCFIKNRKKLVSTFGAKTNKGMVECHEQIFNKESQKFKQSVKFAVKASKIIQESSDEIFHQSSSPQSPNNPSVQLDNFSQNSPFKAAEFQNQVGNLLKSAIFEENNKSGELQEEFNNIFQF